MCVEQTVTLNFCDSTAFCNLEGHLTNVTEQVTITVLTHTLPEQSGAYAGYTQDDFKPDSGSNMPSSDQEGMAQFSVWSQMIICPNTPQVCGVKTINYCFR